MCAIIGLVGERNAVIEHLGDKALHTLTHRGPDAGSTWHDEAAWLGHRRLSIIDLSAASNQPFLDPESGSVIVFNGEIYNYIELRRELEALGHKFRTSSDTEVLLKGYAVWGDAVLSRCNGMFAFAIWNSKTRKLFMARDRFGVKPLYYTIRPNQLLFASEPKALHVLDPHLTEIAISSVIDFFVDSRAHSGARTFYSGIAALPPAHYAVYDVHDGRLTVSRYWDYPTSGSIQAHENPDDEFAWLLQDSVALRLRSDVNVGLTLSGGLDSSAVLAATANEGNSALKCYTSTFSNGEHSELNWAQLAADSAEITVQPVDSAVADWLDLLKRTTWHMDSPGYSPAVLPLWSIMERARSDGVPVLLEGQGADELLAGYPQYAAAATLGDFLRGRFSQGATQLLYMKQAFTLPWTAAWLARHSMPGLFDRAIRNPRMKMFSPVAVREWQELDEDSTISKVGLHYDPLRRALWQDHAIKVLPSLLHYGDAISMAHGIETRLPFMDYRLVDWVFGTNAPLLRNGETKSLVRNYLRRRNFQKIAARKDKIGYPVPMSTWFQSFSKNYLSDICNNPNRTLWDYLDRKLVRKMIEGQQSARTLFHVYKILTTDIWLEELKRRRTQT